jgi:hypothetical protein
MLRPELLLGKTYVSIISHARTQNVAAMESLVGPATWFVGKGEGAAYRQVGASAVVEAGGLCRSRNAGIDAAMKAKAVCVQLSDDLKKVQVAWFCNERKKNVASDITFPQAIERIWEGMQKTKAHLGGAAPTANPFYANTDKPIHPSAFIVGDCILVHDTTLRFNEEMTLKEDYDYTLRHLAAYGAVARRDDVMLTFLHRTNPGGAVEARTAQLEQDNIARLKADWGDMIADNPRRPNEILLKLPRVPRLA